MTMPKYSTEQKRTIDAINREAKRRYGKGGYSKAERVKIKSAYQTGRVESNFENSSRMTDHDSQGWRQERASLYRNPTNRRASTRRYFDEADQFYRPGMKSHQLAADVQRPAAQYRSRYGQHQGESQSLLNQLVGGGGGQPQTQDKPLATGREEALITLLKDSVSNPSQENRLTGTNIAAALIASKDQPVQEVAATRKPKQKKQRTYSNPWKAAKAAGATVSSGYRPGSITSAGNVSDHTGRPGSGTMARDFVGKDMDKIARAIARSLGLKNYKGGLVNIKKGKYRYQLIWRAEGHYDHVHLGRKPV